MRNRFSPSLQAEGFVRAVIGDQIVNLARSIA